MIYLTPKPGSCSLLRNRHGDSDVVLAAAIAARYTRPGGTVRMWVKDSGREYFLDALAAAQEEIIGMQI